MYTKEITRDWVLFATTVSLSLSCISDGMHYGWASPGLPKLKAKSNFDISDTGVFLIESLYMLGGIAGLPLVASTIDRYGRKMSILLANLFGLASWVLIGLAINVEMIYVARFCAGVATDVTFISVPMYLAEISDKRIRGCLTSLPTIILLVGVIICYSLIPYVSFAISSIIPAIFIIMQLSAFGIFPESPYYHLLKNNILEAEKSLQFFRRSKDVQEELEEIRYAVERQTAERGKLQDLFLVKSNRRGIIIIGALMLGQHMSSISVILMNIHQILMDAEGIIEANTAAILFAVTQFGAILIGSTLVDKYGRKCLLVTSCALSSIVLCSLATYFTLKYNLFNVSRFNWLPVVCVVVYAASFRLGLGIVPFVLAAELFPTNIKAYGMTLSDGMYVGFGFLSILLYNQLSSNFGLHLPFYVFSVNCVLVIIFTLAYIPETKGKSLDEIQIMLRKSS